MPSAPTHNPSRNSVKLSTQESSRNLLDWSKKQEYDFYYTKSKLIKKGLVDQEGFAIDKPSNASTEDFDITYNIFESMWNLLTKNFDIICQLVDQYQSFILLIVFISSLINLYALLHRKFLNFKSNSKEVPVPGIRCPRCYERGIETYVLRGKRCPRCNEQC